MSFPQILVFFLLIMMGCEHKDPKPELKDKIYQDMLAQQSEANRIIADLESKIADLAKTGAEAKINTGIKEKTARQIADLKKTKDKMIQQVSYWKIRSFERLKYVRLLASKKNEAYVPSPDEWDKYQAEKRLRQAKNSWDLKARFKETGFEYNPVLMGEDPGGKALEKPAPPSSGGH